MMLQQLKSQLHKANQKTCIQGHDRLYQLISTLQRIKITFSHCKQRETGNQITSQPQYKRWWRTSKKRRAGNGGLLNPTKPEAPENKRNIGGRVQIHRHMNMGTAACSSARHSKQSDYWGKMFSRNSVSIIILCGAKRMGGGEYIAVTMSLDWKERELQAFSSFSSQPNISILHLSFVLILPRKC